MKIYFRERKRILSSFKTIFRHFYSSFKTDDKKTNIENTLMFEKLCGVVEESEDEINNNVKEEVTEHLESFGKKI